MYMEKTDFHFTNISGPAFFSLSFSPILPVTSCPRAFSADPSNSHYRTGYDVIVVVGALFAAH